MKDLHSIIIIFSLGMLIACKSDSPEPVPEVKLREIEFSNEELITIQGYTGNAMEVDISHDGEVLMFNDRVKVPPTNKSLHWASRIDDTNYKYEGLVAELNTEGVDGTPSFD